MGRVELRVALLTTSSALALVVGVGGAAQAGPCTVNNTFAGLPNTGAIDCVSFNDGANHTGDVVNASTGTITPTGAEGGPFPGTGSGISVLTAGTKLTGNITNNGTITAKFAGINIGGGAFGVPPTTLGVGASVTGTITNNGTLAGTAASGFYIRQSSVGGSIINNNVINTGQVGILVTGVAAHLVTVGGSITNNGTIAISGPGNDGMFVQFATVGGSFSNTNSINTGATGSGAMILANSTVAGSVSNTGSLTAKVVGIDVLASSVGGNVVNGPGGTINAQFGIGFTGHAGSPVTITGSVINNGTINASAGSGIGVFGFKGGVSIGTGIVNTGSINATNGTGIGLYGATVAGGVANIGGTITAKGAGILVGSTAQAAGASSVTGGVTNSGSITGKTGILVNGHATVAGGITNTGSITGTSAAIDLTGEGAASVINQQAGTITGNILLSALADTVNITGGSISGNIVGQGSSNTVNFALGAGTFTYAGIISGVNAVNLNSGTVSLTGTNTYAGATTVNGGILDVGGSIAASILTTVNSGGALTGTGTVGNTSIAGGGGFAPGNGTPGSSMTVSGNLAFASGALYLVQVNPATASFATVTGTATLGGASVSAAFANGAYISKQYTILTAAGGVTGTFAPTIANSNLPANFSDSLSYDATHAFLNLTLNFVPPSPGPTPPNFGGGLNGNQQNIANTLVNFFNTTGSIPLVFGTLTPTGLTLVSGESATGSQQTTFVAMSQFINLLADPFAGRGNGFNGAASPTGYADESDEASAYVARRKGTDAFAMFAKAPPALFAQRWSVWAAGYGGSQSTNGNAVVGSNDTTSRIAGTAVGADYLFSPNTLAGFAIAGGGTSFSVNNLGTGRSDLFQAGAYVRHTQGAAYITGALAYGWQDITTNRTLAIAGIDQLRAEFNANAWSGRVEGGYRFAVPWAGGLGITPYAAGQFTTFDLPAYAETVVAGAANFALAYAAKSVTDSRSELGIRSDKSFAMADGILTLRGRLAWAHDFDPDRAIGATFQALPGASFVVNGAAQASNSALTTASAEWKWINGWSAAATFEGEFSSVTQSYAGKAVVRYVW
jgi:uncharacterized protein with beta-barrel porin domain